MLWFSYVTYMVFVISISVIVPWFLLIAMKMMVWLYWGGDNEGTGCRPMFAFWFQQGSRRRLIEAIVAQGVVPGVGLGHVDCIMNTWDQQGCLNEIYRIATTSVWYD